ncbi:MAG: hypothetical protein E3K29_06095 [Candidatus Brocadia sp.]|nr:hypothetical protein [Candidatus Brocadia sp.]
MSRKSELFLFPVDGLIWTFSEHSIDHTVAEIGTGKMSMVYGRPSCDRGGETLSSRALSWIIFSGGKERLTPVLLRTPSVNRSFPQFC